MMPAGGRLPRPDKRAIARKAALAIVDDGVTIADAKERFRIGWTLIRTAVAALRAERAAAREGARSQP